MAVRPLQYPLITAVSDRRRLAAHDDEACHRLVEWAAVVARAGVDIIQVREQGLTDRALADMVRGVVGAAAGTARDGADERPRRRGDRDEVRRRPPALGRTARRRLCGAPRRPIS